ncbi:MAG: MOSC domain-containing protein [Steroidobacteraceae bacterium]
MYVERICIARAPGGDLVELESVELVAGQGIVGDRYFGRRVEPGQNLTLVAAEQILAINAEYGTTYDLLATRRNLVTRGVDLNTLIGKEFSVGAARLIGVELCEPCATLGKRLAGSGRPPARVVKQFLHRAGLRADIVAGGAIRRGDPLSIPVSPS